MKIVFLSLLSAQFSGGGAKFVFGKLFLIKKGFSENGWCTFFGWGGVQGLGDCCCMMLLDALEGCSKNPIKIWFFEHPLARLRKTKKGPKITPIFGGLKTGRK